MSFAVCVQRRCFRITAKADCAVLVRHASERYALTGKQIPGEQPFMAIMPVNRTFGLFLHQLLQFGDQTLVSLLVIWLVAEHDSSVAPRGDPIVRIRQILRRQPKIERMGGHYLKRRLWGNGRCASFQRFTIELANKRNMSHRVLPFLRAEIKVIYGKRLLEDGRIGAFGNSHENGIDVPHVVPANDIGAVCESARVLVICRPKEQRCRVNRAARNYDDVGGILFRGSVPPNHYIRDLAPARTGLQPLDISVGQQLDARELQRRVHAHHLSIRLRADQTRKTVTRFAANAFACMRIFLIELDAKRYMKWLQPQTSKVITQLLHPRFVAYRWILIRPAGERLSGVCSAFAVYLIQILGFQIIGLEIVVGDGPRRGHAPVVAQLSKILLPQPEQSRSIKLGISPTVVIRVRVNRLTALILPNFFCLIFPFDVYGARIPIVFFARDIIASFQEQDSLTERSKGVGKRSPASASADDDDVELFFSDHVSPPKQGGAQPLTLPPSEPPLSRC